MARQKKTERTQRDRFLDALARTASVTAASQAAGIGRRTAYNWRNADEEFASAWDDALESGTDALEDEAIRRALDGSDTLLIFMLKARRPEKFKERVANEHTSPDGSMSPTRIEIVAATADGSDPSTA